MANARTRRLGRERAMQFLFGLIFSEIPWEEAIDDFWAANPARASAKDYADRLIQGVCEEQQALDEAIDAALTNCAPDRVGRIERVLLRIALYEMRYVSDVPPNVAINEAIEVAKQYAWDEAPRFINGVLDRLRKSESDPPGGPEDPAS